MSAATPAVDLSRLPAPSVVGVSDLETIVAARLADLQQRDPDFDALVESDPALKLQETDAYRELMALAAINDAARSRMLAFALGPDLDHLAAFYDVPRLVIAPASGSTPAVMEGDEAFRRRVLLAPKSFAGAGPHGAWLFHALSADARVLNADVWSPAAGQVTVAVQSREGDGTASDELVEAVRLHLAQKHIKPMTDMLTVRSVVNVPYAIEVQGYVQPGPSLQLIRAEMIAALQAMAATRRTPSRDVPRSAIYAAASVGPIDKVIVVTPSEDIARANGEVGVCTAIDVTVSDYAG